MSKELKKVTKKAKTTKVAKSTKATKPAKAAKTTKTTKATKTTKPAKVTKTTKKELSAKDRKKVTGGKLDLKYLDLLNNDALDPTGIYVFCENKCSSLVKTAELFVGQYGTQMYKCHNCGHSWPRK